MFGPNGYSGATDNCYSKIVDPHIAPAINLLITEYFNMFDGPCQKMTACTIALILKR